MVAAAFKNKETIRSFLHGQMRMQIRNQSGKMICLWQVDMSLAIKDAQQSRRLETSGQFFAPMGLLIVWVKQSVPVGGSWGQTNALQRCITRSLLHTDLQDEEAARALLVANDCLAQAWRLTTQCGQAPALTTIVSSSNDLQNTYKEIAN